MKKFIIIICIFISVFSEKSYSQQWISFNEDTLGDMTYPTVHCFYPEDSLLYVGGGFHYGGQVLLDEIGIWNENEWQAMPDGFYNGGGVRTITRYKGQIYAAGGYGHAFGAGGTGSIPNTDYIARWNGANWEALPSSYGGLGSYVRDLTIYNDSLIIASNFPSLPTSITAYDADTNDYVNIGIVTSIVNALEVYNGELYAGGWWFTLKKYIGGTGLAAWEDVGGSLNYYIQDMKVDTFNNFLYVGGGFFVVDDSILTDNVAIWNGFYWEGIGGYGGISDVMSLEIYNGDLYTGRSGDSAGGVFTGSLARWDGTDWHCVGGGIWDGGPYALEEFQNKLYVGGAFDTVGGIRQKGIACWEDTTPNCRHLKPRVFSDTTTYYLVNDTAQVQFYNNNAYVDTWSWDFGDSGTDTVKDPLHIYTDTGTYDVTVTVTHGTCTKTATKTIVVDYPVNVGKLMKKEIGFKLYPNPTSHTLFVEISDNKLLNNKLQIIDINGKTILLMSLNSGKQSVDISALTNGIYFVKIGEQTERFVKE